MCEGEKLSKPHLLDVEGLKIFIQMAKDPLDLKIPMLDEFKIHFMAQRGQILDNYRKQAAGMAILMQCIAPQHREDAEYIEAQDVIRDYQDWIISELAKLQELGKAAVR
jgi:hypothetical protein